LIIASLPLSKTDEYEGLAQTVYEFGS